LTRSTQKPVSSLKNVTRSIRPVMSSALVDPVGGTGVWSTKAILARGSPHLMSAVWLLHAVRNSERGPRFPDRLPPDRAPLFRRPRPVFRL